jgi:hypothetical protein
LSWRPVGVFCEGPALQQNFKALGRQMKMLRDTILELSSLRDAFPKPDAALVDELLLRRISKWADDETSVQTLVDDLERLLGGVWFSTHERHALVHLVLARLRDLVDAVGGMTMNERLVLFSLEERWDGSSETDRAALRKKLLA